MQQTIAAKPKPIAKFSDGQAKVAVWKNVPTKEKPYETLSYSIQRSYKTEAGWKNSETISFSKEQLLHLQLAMQKALLWEEQVEEISENF